MKETYLKPEVTSEVLEPGTLLVAGSPAEPPEPGPFLVHISAWNICCV